MIEPKTSLKISLKRLWFYKSETCENMEAIGSPIINNPTLWAMSFTARYQSGTHWKMHDHIKRDMQD